MFNDDRSMNASIAQTMYACNAASYAAVLTITNMYARNLPEHGALEQSLP